MGQCLLPCGTGSLYLRRVPCCHFSSEQQPGSSSTAEHSPSPQGRVGTSRLAEAGGWDGDRDRSYVATDLQASDVQARLQRGVEAGCRQCSAKGRAVLTTLSCTPWPLPL